MMGATTLGSPDAKGLNGTKKTITDFFGKSPQNSPSAEGKPKDLLGYFTKTSSCNKNSNNVLQSSFVEELSELASSPKSYKNSSTPVNNTTNSVDSKNKKRKYNGKELLVSSDSPSTNGDSNKSKKRKTNKGTDLFQKETSPPIKEKNLFSNPKEENHSEDIHEERAVPELPAARKAPGKPVRRSLAKPKRSGGQKSVDELTKPLECDVSSKDLEDDLSPDLCEDGKDEDVDRALELSYEEFLLSQETDTESEKLEVETQHTEPEKLEVETQQTEPEKLEVETQQTEPEKLEVETQQTEPEKLEVETQQTEPEKLDDTPTASPCQKATKPVSIATFFSQLKKTPKEENPDSRKVTVLADIHPEPRQKPPSPEKKPTGSKSGEVVPKSISLDAKSKLEEEDCIVFLSTEHSSGVKELPPCGESKPKSVKKVSSSSDRGSKKSVGKGKDSSASDVKDGKSSQSLLNFGGKKPLLLKPQEDTLTPKNTDSSKSTPKLPEEKSLILVEDPEDNNTDASVKAAVDTETTLEKKRGRPLKKKRGRPRKISIVAPEEDEAPVKKEADSLGEPKEENGNKESQMSVKGDRKIADTKTEIPVSQKAEKNSGKIKCDEQEKTKGLLKEVTTDLPEEKTLSSKDSPKSNESTPGAEESVATTPGTRRSARLRDHKVLSPPSYAEEVDSVPVTPKTRKEKKKSDSGLSEKSKETSTGKESNTKQADSEKLAPIFMKKKEKEKSKINVLDEEAIKLRRAFLMSGLTEEAKKQQQANAVMFVAPPMDYPPIPVENHIQQKPVPEEDENERESKIDVWNLPEVSLAGLSVSDGSLEAASLPTSEWKCRSSLVRTCEDNERPRLPEKSFSGHSHLSENEISTAIKVLLTANPSYPVQRFYEMAKTRSKNNLKTDVESTKPKEKPVEQPKPVPEKPKGRAATRRSLARRKSSQKQNIPDESSPKEKEEKPDCPVEEKGCDILWTEKYQPQHSVEVISNCGNLKKLKSWLVEWKQQTDREIRKMNKLLQKQRKNKKIKGEDSSSTSSWMDDDSNFEMSTSESDDDSLCNTMLLTGPHGVGKTSAIYALAAELGYQVFEVNASSARSGKKILTQLLEATQSHQVSKDKTEQTPVGNVGIGANLANQMKETSKDPVKKTAPASFANFFKSSKDSKTDSVADSKKPETAKSKKRQTTLSRTNGVNKTSKTLSSAFNLTNKSCKLDPNDSGSNGAFDTPADRMRKQVNISSTSLILFDEVDVVLDEDKGFWAAIQNFMQSTKRPIILTASSLDVAEQFGNSCEHLSFRLPSTKVTTSHLQTLCLAENVMTDSSEISNLVGYFKGDMRSCLLNLQFWINSGGDLTKKNSTNSSTTQPSDMVTSGSGTESSDPPKETLSKEDEDRLIHRHCLESCLGLNPAHLKMLFNDDLIKQCSDSISWEDLTPACHHGYQCHFSLLHQLFPSKLPLPRKHFPPLPNRVQKRYKARKQVASISSPWMVDFATNSMYDTESSLDEPLFISLPKEREDKIDTNSQPISCSQESEASCSASQSASLQMESVSTEELVHPKPTSKLQPEDISRQRNCENKILSNMAKFYDCCSYNETFLKSCGYVDYSGPLPKYSATSRSTLTAGLWDELPMEDTKTQRSHLMKENILDVIANLELRTYVNCLQDISQAAEEVIDGHEHSISIAPQQKNFGLVNLQPCDQSQNITHSKAVENVLSNIPLFSGFQHNSLYLDYLPMLREVCRAEKTRQLAKMKRRFFHYFDNIGFPLRESTLNVLANGFT